ncbi:hypothetical protein DAPPUDRAFT_114218 [Daphnia pulex]|uniref:Uncharacterized protein n=1 Tax=Daphnia pulex TaxID=6669 RepID=E9HHF1_DAPPU|nr:hypothetical protein DAPPUDRAFT_114218 [Daphnia pulex]|eukprot:EFX68853.1 hypothetical protein DAPPUDRAFT_114218 [Daphnia pulex]
MLQRATDASSRKKIDYKNLLNELPKFLVSWEHRDFFNGSEESQDSDCTAKESIPEVVEQPQALSNSEHAYSSFSRGKNSSINLQDNFTFLTKFCWNLDKSDGSGCMAFNKKNVRKYPLVPRQLNFSVLTSSSNVSSSCPQNIPLITLSSQTAAKLDDLILTRGYQGSLRTSCDGTSILKDENDEFKQETKKDEEIGWEENAIKL